MEGSIGQILLFAGSRLPLNWFFCDGRLLVISEYPALFSLIGTKFGGDGVTNFAIPNLEDKQMPGLRFVICYAGVYPMAD